MFTRLTTIAAFCLLLSTTVLAQARVDFRDAVKAAHPGTIAVLVEGAEAPAFMLQTGVGYYFSPQTINPDVAPVRSGFAMSPELVISCELPDDAKEVKVVTHDGRELTGKVVARDHVTELVAIRVENGSLSGLVMSADAPQAGAPALISWLHRGKTAASEAAMIASRRNSQHAMLGFSQLLDADFVPEKMGAPVVDENGSLVGVVMNRDDVTLCLSVEHVARLIEAASANEPSDLHRGRMGIRLDESQGATIVEVMEGTVAAEAELKAGDRIAKIGDHQCTTHSDVMAMTAMSRAGDEITVEIERGNETFERTLKLASVEPQKRHTTFFPSTVAPSVSQQLLKLKDGKLVPMNNPEVEFKFNSPNLMLGNLQVERSKLEDSLKKLEAEKKQQDGMIKRLRDKISAMEAESAATLDKKFRDELARFEKIIQEIKEKNKSKDDD